MGTSQHPELEMVAHTIKFQYSWSPEELYHNSPNKFMLHWIQNSNLNLTSPRHSQKLRQEAPGVTMKIIDFANVSLPGPGAGSEGGGGARHEGPDDGFILGLDNLHQILQTIADTGPHFYLWQPRHTASIHVAVNIIKAFIITLKNPLRIKITKYIYQMKLSHFPLIWNKTIDIDQD